jgi:hypothetical protein
VGQVGQVGQTLLPRHPATAAPAQWTVATTGVSSSEGAPVLRFCRLQFGHRVPVGVRVKPPEHAQRFLEPYSAVYYHFCPRRHLLGIVKLSRACWSSEADVSGLGSSH